jgi:hypothetical protein
MIKVNAFNQYAKIVALAAVVHTGSSQLVSAHSLMACWSDVKDFCGDDQDCLDAGKAGCAGPHGHQLGTPPPAPDPAMDSVFGVNPRTVPPGVVGVNPTGRLSDGLNKPMDRVFTQSRGSN